jgi:uncharacterized protein (DUF58 family)
MSPVQSVVSRPGPALTPLGKISILILVAAAVVGVVPPVAFAGGIVLVLADAMIACALFRPVEMGATVPPFAVEGQPVPVELRHSGLHEDVRLTIDNDALNSLGSAQGGGRTSMFIAAPHRGRFLALSVRGVLVGPLGLGCALRRWAVPLPSGHNVVPRSADAPGVDVEARPRAELAESDDGVDVGSRLRDHRAGDPLRTVHWAASARHGVLLVRTGAEVCRTVRMAVDPGRSEQYADAVVSVAMAMGSEVLARGDELHLTFPVASHHLAEQAEAGAPAAPAAGPHAYLSPPLRGGSSHQLVSATVTDLQGLGATLALAEPAGDFSVDGAHWPGTLDDGHFDLIVRARPEPPKRWWESRRHAVRLRNRDGAPSQHSPGVAVDAGAG